MSTLSNDDFKRIAAFLRSLPRRSDPSTRSESWRTANQLLSLVRSQDAPCDGRELDAALCERFLSNEDCPIRPAYYPGEDSLKRLWGHKDIVGPGPGRRALQDKLAAQPRPLETDCLLEAAPTVFISHALEDHHFAARVRLNLARHGIRSWLAEGELHEGDNLFEAIEIALNRCHALMILISSLSISSAWVYTETLTALGADKKIVALIDASDTPICVLLRGWLTERQKQLAGKKHEDWLITNEGIQASAAVLERYMRVASPSRVLKFHREVEYTLNSLTMAGYVAFYPDVPRAWADATSWNGFDGALKHLGIQIL